MEGLQERIKQWLSTNREYGISLLQQLVQVASTQGNEAQAQHIVIKALHDIGLIVDSWQPEGEQLINHPYFASSRHDFKGSSNVVGVLRGAGGGRSIILNGHIDVVPAGDRTQWQDDPFSGKVVDGKMYGRGVTDMKGGNVALLMAIKALQEIGIRLKGDVIFQSVIEEESGGSGTLAAILRGYQADAAIIPEPTNLKIFPKQQGSQWFKIHVKGRAAHGGTRYEGVSAIEKSYLVIEHIRKLEEIRNERMIDPLYRNIPIPIPINIGKITGGDWPSSVADLVTMEGRMGISPDETIEEAKVEMENWLKNLKNVDPWFQDHPHILEWYGARWLPGSIDVEHDLMKILTKSYRTVLKDDPVIEASPWGTDGGLLTTVGETPSIVFGPGVTKMAHFPNEYIEIDKMIEAAEIIALTLVEWCGLKE
ncbi:peptidase [Halalkalibacter nanhaiisediminis]|uniref:4-acetamidobutyryl-CoA deacetylase n=1 Tax=Halalkalibacter nanhaiisediminis TaxID=688079 RepID=A0A562QQL9_9BACI|nr:peptidase [Halalkalibacter nanhaiisediminis]TWI59052.1 4-acetamidobutyryl-CoA deacetylase [Halalkalibacter nanhaiisediminis]